MKERTIPKKIIAGFIITEITHTVHVHQKNVINLKIKIFKMTERHNKALQKNKSLYLCY